jgi:hypothetical protein
MKKTLIAVVLVVAVVLGIGLPTAVFADYTAVDIEKYVSVDGGTTWEDADDDATAPIATVGQDVLFKVTVQNLGVSTLNSVTVTDSDFTFTGVVSTLAPGELDESDVVTVTALEGLQYDLAEVTATGCYCVADSDPAYYTGERRGCEGLTPGYWKNHLNAWVGYDPNDPTLTFLDVFGVGPDESLLDVLNTGGGKFIALDRHAVAALLNANALDYPYAEAEVIAMVQDAYDTGDWSSAKNTLEDANQLSDS